MSHYEQATKQHLTDMLKYCQDKRQKMSREEVLAIYDQEAEQFKTFAMVAYGLTEEQYVTLVKETRCK